MKPKTIKHIAVAAVVVVAIAALFWWSQRPKPIPVRLHSVASGPVEETVANTRAGTVEACRRSRLSLEIGGQVTDLYVAEGDQVEQNELLLELMNADLKAAVAHAEASLKAIQLQKESACLTAEFDERELNRIKALVDKDLASEDQVDRARTKWRTSRASCLMTEADREMAEANLAQQQARLQKTALRAPFAGVVAEINGEVGEYVTPSPPGVATPPAVDLIDDQCLLVTAPIDEVDAAQVSIGMPVRITLDAFRDRSFEGRVTRIAPYVLDLEKQARTVDVEVRFVDPEAIENLLVGYSADVEIILQQKHEALRVPSEAVVESQYVYRYVPEAQLIEKQRIEKGLANWTYTQVLSGLSQGDRIVTSLEAKGLEDGVHVIPET